MTASPLVWTLTIAGIIALLLFDFFFHVRKAHTSDPARSRHVVGTVRRHRAAVRRRRLVFGGTVAGSSTSPGTSPRRRCRSTTSSSSSSS